MLRNLNYAEKIFVILRFQLCRELISFAQLIFTLAGKNSVTVNYQILLEFAHSEHPGLLSSACFGC